MDLKGGGGGAGKGGSGCQRRNRGQLSSGGPKDRTSKMMWISEDVMGNLRKRRSTSGTGPPKRREGVYCM